MGQKSRFCVVGTPLHKSRSPKNISVKIPMQDIKIFVDSQFFSHREISASKSDFGFG